VTSINSGHVSLRKGMPKEDPSMAEKIVIALDSDYAGAKAAWKFWPETYGSKVRRWPCVLGKDPSEAWHNGLDIEAWIAVGISITDMISNS
jgi:hypothetical protein